MRINEQMKEVFTSLGLNIKNLREKQKVSLQELSLKTGIRKEYLEKIEKGSMLARAGNFSTNMS